jgi:hypothetical protein
VRCRTRGPGTATKVLLRARHRAHRSMAEPVAEAAAAVVPQERLRAVCRARRYTVAGFRAAYPPCRCLNDGRHDLVLTFSLCVSLSPLAHRTLQPCPESGQTAEFLHGACASVGKQRRHHTAQRGSGTKFKSCHRAGRSAALEASGPVDGGRYLTGQLVDVSFNVENSLPIDPAEEAIPGAPRGRDQRKQIPAMRAPTPSPSRFHKLGDVDVATRNYAADCHGINRAVVVEFNHKGGAVA